MKPEIRKLVENFRTTAKNVQNELKEKGAIFVDELSEVKDNSRPVIFSAHGVPKSVPNEAKLKNLSYVDATCPLVSINLIDPNGS